MKHQKYNSIINTYMKRTMDEIESQGLLEGKFYVSEKIHGANFSFIVDSLGRSISRCYKRGKIGIDEKFYNHELIDHDESMFKLFDIVKDNYDNVSEIQVYGELFGGYYPHEDVEQFPKLARVNKGVYYHPSIKWLAFDIRVNNDFFIDANKKYSLFELSGVPFIPYVKVGNIKECIEFDKCFQSYIHEMYDLPAFEDNICEGVVITPETERFKGEHRIIFKNKNDKFSEKGDDYYKVKDEELDEQVKKAIYECSVYVTENRFMNTLSKDGPFDDFNQFGKIIGAFSKDIFKDFYEENPEFIKMDKKDKNKVHREIMQLARKIVKDYASSNISLI